MKRLLSLAQYIKQGIIKRIIPDKSKMKQMRNMAQIREDFLEEHVDDKFIALHLEAFHDIIQELLFAQLYKKGLSCTTDESLLAFAIKEFSVCHNNKDVLIQLFSLRRKIHTLKPLQIKKFLQTYHNALYIIVQELKR
ncbi:MAG: hypothetical protein WC254_07760 [Candidatus Woesearchaeota archaeon]|jgi:hypothetical protein